MGRPTSADSTMRWVWRGSALAVLLLGWAFILVQHNFHVTAPVVVISLGFLAVVAAIYTLFRTGASAVAANEEDDGDAAWGKPMGAYAELEREKRALLKAIKEAEFDLQMGKLSKKDADEMIATYRARAIEVIKEIDVHNTSTGQAGTVREKILREARARLEIEALAKADKPARPGKGGKADKRAAGAMPKQEAAASAPAEEAAEDAKPAAAKADAVVAQADAVAAQADAMVATAAQADATATAAPDAAAQPVAAERDAAADAANGAPPTAVDPPKAAGAATPAADPAEDARPDRESKEAAR